MNGDVDAGQNDDDRRHAARLAHADALLASMRASEFAHIVEQVGRAREQGWSARECLLSSGQFPPGEFPPGQQPQIQPISLEQAAGELRQAVERGDLRELELVAIHVIREFAGRLVDSAQADAYARALSDLALALALLGKASGDG